MANGKLLRQLIKSGASGDAEAFRRASEAVIKEERQKQHHLLANDLESILYGKTIPFRPDFRKKELLDVPCDKERGLPLIELREATRGETEIVLSDQNTSFIEEVIQEYGRSEVLQTYGLRPAEKLLFCGPPGCGKTLAAEVLASELDRPLGIVRIDTVVSSYLGETSANLRKVFDFAQMHPIVLLFDEFDAIAKERSDATEHGELKRVVNSVLQMMDSLRSETLFICTSNHEKMLDSAVWRRFDDVILFERPSTQQIKKLLALKLRAVRLDFSLEDQSIVNPFNGMAHADIERVLRRAIKDMVLQGREFLTEANIRTALAREESRIKLSKGSHN
jgi:SpoVK/Ycf46/Vps4 family AAA+-type ATPase